MKIELQKQLFQKYSKFFENVTHISKNKKVKQLPIHEEINIEDGWFNLLDMLFEAINKYININRYPKLESFKFKIESITNKDNRLVIYYTGGDDIIIGMVKFAESMSLTTCEKCGNIKDKDKPCKCNKKCFEWKKLLYTLYNFILKVLKMKKR